MNHTEFIKQHELHRIYYITFITQNLLYNIYNTEFIIHHLSHRIYYTTFITHNLLYNIYYTEFIIQHLSHRIYYTTFITQKLLYNIYYTEYLAQRFLAFKSTVLEALNLYVPFKTKYLRVNHSNFLIKDLVIVQKLVTYLFNPFLTKGLNASVCKSDKMH